jgi:hypothetical protein
MKGVAFAHLVAGIEAALHKPACEIFDMMSGGSTGGLIALGLAHGYSATALKDLYYTMGSKIFNQENLRDSQKAGASLDSVMREIFKERRMSEALIPVLVQVHDASRARAFDAKYPPTLQFSIESHEISLKRQEFLDIVELSSEAAKENKENWDCLVWEAARANSTLPIFNKASICFNHRVMTDLIDTTEVPLAGMVKMAQQLYPQRAIELYIIGDQECDFDFLKKVAEHEKEYWSQKFQDILTVLDDVAQVYSLSLFLEGSEHDARKETLDAKVSVAEEFINTRQEFQNIIKQLENSLNIK